MFKYNYFVILITKWWTGGTHFFDNNSAFSVNFQFPVVLHWPSLCVDGSM